MALHYAAWHETLLPYGIDLPRSFIDTMPACRRMGLWRRSTSCGTSSTAMLSGNEGARSRRGFPRRCPWKKWWRRRAYHGKLPIAVVCGGTQDMVHATLEAIHAFDLFPVIITASDPVAPKPSPDVFLEAARRLGVAAGECHVFEDGDPGIIAAQRAGMTYTDVRLVLKAKAS